MNGSRALRRAAIIGVAVAAAAVLSIYGAQITSVQAPPGSSTAGIGRDGSYIDALSQANRLTPADVADLESAVVRNPEDMDARGKLIAYYFLQAKGAERSRHALWVIEHHPESDLASAHQSLFSARPNPLNSEADYARAREMWLEHASRSDADARVLGHAGQFLMMSGDFNGAEQNLKLAHERAPKERRWTMQLAMLYAMAIHGAPPPSPEVTAFSEHAKQELLATADGEVVRQALFILHSSGSPAVPQGSRSAEVNDFTRALADRAERDFGIKAAVPTMPGATSTASDPKQIRVGATVQAAKLLKKADPVYPPLAQQARIQGTVRFNAVIGTDGRMKTLTLVSGHPLMVGPAQDAAQQYEYQPTLLNGVAVEVVTTVDVDFRLAQ